ncbi:glycoside hydrolase family 92 protein [Moniliophthora roreri MCA 2997]|uniref:Glycoside hydrolase family 92 protein n=2 Tax=Moniliophthora roreri TaxID=221103 RepID=V2WSZ4_MONRO|nr:glycoside hydrolase family 92 protein [Moniliophthora roreri MCA 2997]KAI3604968.1 glycoside hydrolase family 92 protein [Moniliophthora roreri]
MVPRLPSKGSVLLSSLFLTYGVNAQPSPDVQSRISAAIKNAGSNPDYTTFVNPFIGTDNFGNVCPGASVPFGMVKFSTDFTGYAPAGYVADPTQKIRGISPLHDSGIGPSSGSYGNFEVMPMTCDSFNNCPTSLNDRQRLRQLNTDDAYPGYFAQTIDNGIKIEATSTRRAGIERFTFPNASKPYFVIDMTNDLGNTFSGGSLRIDPHKGRINVGGLFATSFGPQDDRNRYAAFACYDVLDGGKLQLDEYGVWNASGKFQNETAIDVPQKGFGDGFEAGALISYKGTPQNITWRVGVSFVSAERACANLDSEVGSSSFKDIVSKSKALWNDKLRKIELDIPNTPENVVEMFYSSLYRSNLTPNNATDEAQGTYSAGYANTTHPYYDSLYCSWDTYRTFFPLLSLTSPVEFAQIVDAYLDGWRTEGWMPECRANNLPGWSQGGSSADNIVSHFALAYHNEAQRLGINLDELYSALLADGDENPPNWYTVGRQINVYKQYGYVPYDSQDPSAGIRTREASRTPEYAFEDFGIRQVALLLGKAEDEARYANRSLNYRNVWDPSVQSDGYQGFMQKRYRDGRFQYTDPVWCSPRDTGSRSCSLQNDNDSGFYESSSWEYSFMAQQDVAGLITLMGGPEMFVKRLDHLFEGGYYLPGNEPSFHTPAQYHYANQPTKSVDRVRDVVFSNFDITPGGIPGNDDQGAMASLLIWHLLGLYPIPSTTQILVISPFIPKYTIHNDYLGKSTTVTVKGYDRNSVQKSIPQGAAAYVKSVTINGKPSFSRCHIDFYDVFRVGGDVVIEVTANKAEANDCLGAIPDSLSTGGFAKAR